MEEKKQVFHGILLRRHSTECVDCDLLKVSKLAHHLLIIGSDDDFQDKLMAKVDHILLARKIIYKGSISRSNSIQKVLRRAVKHCAALGVYVGENPEKTVGTWLSWPINFCDQLSANSILRAVHKEKIFFKRHLIHQNRGLKFGNWKYPSHIKMNRSDSDQFAGFSRPKFYIDQNQTSIVEAPTKSYAIESSEDDALRDESGSLKEANSYKRSISVIRKELPESTLGWPLLRRTAPSSQEALRNSEARNMSLVEWDENRTNISINGKTNDSNVKDDNIKGSIILPIQTCESESVDGSSKRKDDRFGLTQKVSSSSFPLFRKESTKSRPGWPLLHVKMKESEPREMTVVQWVMGLPDRSKQAPTKSICDFGFNEIESSAESHTSSYEDERTKTCLVSPGKLPKKLELVLRLNSTGCKQFCYKELKRATCQFSSENFIGEGGYSNVYKGCLPCGKSVAIKIIKQYKEAWNDFSLEVDIMSTLKNKHITPLIGVCVEDNHLILVYDFLSKGSLEESLQSHGEKSKLPWKVRFKIAIAIAEALNYLHNESSLPVIHRDVKSSNILLSDEFQPQLSDFGLAIWGPADSAYMVHSDVVGTFGYIAPEYFMHGRVSDKIDVYSFGIVLLELLTGKKPITSKGLKGQESLVKWATPFLENRDLRALLDPKAEVDLDDVQMRRMVLAANLCIKQSSRLRPKMSQILELLKEEKDEREWMNCYVNDLMQSSNQEVDDIFPKFGGKPGSDFSFLDLDDDASTSSVEQKQHFMLKDYLKERQD